MALDRPLLRRRRVFAAATETTNGTPVALASGDAKFNAYDREITNEINMVDREAQGSLGMQANIAGARMGQCSVSTFLHGSGASGLPLWATALMTSSGFAVVGSVLVPTSQSASTTTVGMYEDGNLTTLAGCMFDWTWTFAAGQPVRADWVGTGKFMEPTSSTLINRTPLDVTEPTFAGGTLTIGGTAYKASEVVIRCGNNVVMREDANADDDPSRSGNGTGYRSAIITSRDIEITMDVEEDVNSTKNWTQDRLDGDTAALAITLGSETNNTIAIAAPALFVKNDQPGDRNGIMVRNLTCGCAVNSAGGNDELTVTFS